MIRRVVVTALATAGLALALSPAPASALPYCKVGYQCTYEWLSEDGAIVGVLIRNYGCTGTTYSEGVRTTRLRYSEAACN
ncbi:MAG TPA: hypothetical protein VGD67_14230 [Pseudonocardiaceae bacterium]